MWWPMRLTAMNLDSSLQTDVLKSRKGAIILAKRGHRWKKINISGIWDQHVCSSLPKWWCGMTGHLTLLPASLLHHDGLDPQMESQNNLPSLLHLLGMFVIKKEEVSNYHTCYLAGKLWWRGFRLEAHILIWCMGTQKERDFKWQR